MIDSVGSQYPVDNPAVLGHVPGSAPVMNQHPIARKRATSARPDDFNLDWRGLLRSFQRRWFLCLAIGLLLGGIVATVGWFVIPAPYVAESEFYIKSYDDNVLFNTNERQANFNTRKQSNQRLLRGREVITAALRDPKASSGLARIAPGVADPVEWLGEKLEVNNTSAEFFTVGLRGDHPQDLANIVNAVSDAFIETVVLGARDERLDRITVIENELQRTTDDLNVKHQALKDMFERNQAATPQMSRQRHAYLLEMHVNLRKQLGAIELELIKARTQQQLLGETPQGELEISDAVIDAHAMEHPEYKRLSDQLAQLESWARRVEGNSSPGHPQIDRARRRVAEAQAVLDQLRAEIRPHVIERMQKSHAMAGEMNGKQLADHIHNLEALKAQYEEEFLNVQLDEKSSGLASIELDKLDKDIARMEKMAATMEDEIARRRFETRTPQLPIEIYEKAQPPTEPDLKNRIMGAGVGGLGLFGMVVVGITLLDLRTRRISSVEELSGDVPLRLMGSIPAMPQSALNDTATSSRQVQKNLFWQSAFKESIDAARTMLISEANRAGQRVIMIGSACSSEGKTTLACHLATSLARAGRRVLLVDCDLRRPSVHRVFGVEEGPGVCEVMRSEAELPDVIQKGVINGLDVIAAGVVDALGLEHLASNALAPVFARLREEYDFVIVDSSPVLPVCDALLVAQLMDGVMVSVRRDVSRRDNVTAAINRFASVGVPILGAVTIGLDDDPVGYGGFFRNRARLRYGQDYLVGSS